MRMATDGRTARTDEHAHDELADGELDQVTGGVVNIQFSFPGIVFRVGKDANGTSFISAHTGQKGVTVRGTD
ncbi:hypothetical protein [Methylobacterium oryzisoli]|jgi:hypothetical protein|uniref:hypothetical protein n=1 Tax=Methylobacterium oryzisoli TaxID=3385502 RepID=UPI003891C6F6